MLTSVKRFRSERRVDAVGPDGIPLRFLRQSTFPCRRCGEAELRWTKVSDRWRAVCARCGKFFGLGS
jgi:hypothetical protein